MNYRIGFILVSLLISSTPVMARDLLQCNDGALIVRNAAPAPGGSPRFEAEINDQGVIQWFLGQAKEQECGPSYYGGQVCVEKAFPGEVRLLTIEGKLVLRLTDLRKNSGVPGVMTSYPGSGVIPKGKGSIFTLKGAHMPNSHTNIEYTVGSWFFESCTKL